jgi:hypothetical protein
MRSLDFSSIGQGRLNPTWSKFALPLAAGSKVVGSYKVTLESVAQRLSPKVGTVRRSHVSNWKRTRKEACIVSVAGIC